MTCPSCSGLGHGERTGALCRACNGSGLVSSDPMLLTPDEIQLAALQAERNEALRQLEDERTEVEFARLTAKAMRGSAANLATQLDESRASAEKLRDHVRKQETEHLATLAELNEAEAQVAALRDCMAKALDALDDAGPFAPRALKAAGILDHGLAAKPAPKVDPYDTGTVGSGRKHWRLPDEPKPDRTHSLDDGCPGGHREVEPKHGLEGMIIHRQACPFLKSFDGADCTCRAGWLSPDAVARVREAISHALLNAKWITGGDERRLKEALALLPEVKP